MRGLPSVTSTASYRVRRWDALVLGGALPGLVAAIRLAKRGARVLLVEEEAALAGFDGLREPFLMTGTDPESVLGSCLRALGVPLIDRRRLVDEPVALQVVLPHARVDVGRPSRTADELVAWGLDKPESARALLEALDEAGRAERERLLAAPFVRSGLRGVPRRLARDTAPAAGRGLPAELEAAPPALRTLFAAVERSLSNLAGSGASPQARARLLGSVLEGGCVLAGGNGWLRGLLRRRIESLFGEFRTLAGRARLVTVAGQPGLAVEDSDEIWAGRGLVINAPLCALDGVLVDGSVPPALRRAPATHRRVSVHLRGRHDALPECLSDRVVCIEDPERPLEGPNLVTLRTFRGAAGRDQVDLVGSAVVPLADGPPDPGAAIEAAIRRVLPFSERALKRHPLPQPVWDGDGALPVDPAGKSGWPTEIAVRLSARPALYALDRPAAAGLGFEGDLLLGWRGGDAIAAELA